MLGFGPHLTLDGYGCDRALISEISNVYRLLEEMPREIGMTKIMPPYVFEYSGLKPEDWGISGFVLIAESHISIHTFPEKRFISIDIFSCKDFDIDKAVAMFHQAFGIERSEQRVMNRGLEFPKSMAFATDIVRHQRHEQMRSNGNGIGMEVAS